MFERYTEKARRAIFFARYEASQFGSPYIETEHLLLGVLREDKALVSRFLPADAASGSIRRQIEAHTTVREQLATSVDLPLSPECKRVLAYAAEEAQQLNHGHIGTPHLLLGLLREEQSFAAQLLRQRGLALASVREEVQQSEAPVAERRAPFIRRLDQWLADCQALDGIWIAKGERVANWETYCAIYAGDQPEESDKGEGESPAEKLAQIQNRLNFIINRMENAIANHEFEKARFYSGEENKERENLRLLREQFNLEELPSRTPVLCVDLIREDRFSDVQKRCDDYIAAGVAHVWMLELDLKRAYTVTEMEGFREFKGKILKIASAPLEMDLNKIFY